MQLVGPGHSQRYKLLGLQGPSYEEEIMSMFIGPNVCCMIQESSLVTDSLIEKNSYPNTISFYGCSFCFSQ